MSDYDIAILIVGEMAPQTRHKLAHELACLLGVEQVDLVILNRAPIELRYHVVAEGQLLYQRDLASPVEFEADTLSRYADFLSVLRQQRQQIIKGGDDEIGVRRYRVERNLEVAAQCCLDIANRIIPGSGAKATGLLRRDNSPAISFPSPVFAMSWCTSI